MPSLEYFVVAESYSVDRDTSAISIFNVLSKLTVEKIPHVIKQLVAIACWISSQEEIDSNQVSHIEVVISTPGSESTPYRGGFKPATRFQHVVLDLSNGLDIAREGDITFELLLNHAHSATHTIEVDLKQD